MLESSSVAHRPLVAWLIFWRIMSFANFLRDQKRIDDQVKKQLLPWLFSNPDIYTRRVPLDPPKLRPDGKPKTRPVLSIRGQWRRFDWRTGQIMPTRFGVIDVDCPLEDFNETIPSRNRR